MAYCLQNSEVVNQNMSSSFKNTPRAKFVHINIQRMNDNKRMTPLTVEELKEALTQDEQTELDQPVFLNPLLMCLEGINNHQSLTEAKKHAVAEKLRDLVRQRTSVHKAVTENPDVLNTKIEPVVIIGLARSGTTMMHRLLSCDPKFVAPMTWELLHPCPPGRPENWKECDRFQKAKKSLDTMALGINIDQVKHIHEMKLGLPDECIFILQAAMLDIGFNIGPAFTKWKDFSFYPPEENLKEAYKYYKKALQCIFYKGLDNGKTALLKSPMHTLYIDMYRALFPNAKFIFPYRNAREMVGSGCSILNLGKEMGGLEYGKNDVKNYTLELYKLGSSRVVQALNNMPKESFFTISYSNMVKDPMAAMKNLYSNFGWAMTPEVEDNMQHHMQENRQHKLGQHKYSVEDFGITDEELRENLSDFLDYFEGDEKLL